MPQYVFRPIDGFDGFLYSLMRSKIVLFSDNYNVPTIFSNSFSIRLSSHAQDKTILRDCNAGVVTLLGRRSVCCGDCTSCTQLTAAAAQGPQAVAAREQDATSQSRSFVAVVGVMFPSRSVPEMQGVLILFLFSYCSFSSCVDHSHCFRLYIMSVVSNLPRP